MNISFAQEISGNPLPIHDSSTDCILELRAQLQDRERQVEEERQNWQLERERLYTELRDAQRSAREQEEAQLAVSINSSRMVENSTGGQTPMSSEPASSMHSSHVSSPPLPAMYQQQAAQLAELERERLREKGIHPLEMSGTTPVDALPTFGGRESIGLPMDFLPLGGDVAAGGSTSVREPVSELSELKKNIRAAMEALEQGSSERNFQDVEMAPGSSSVSAFDTMPGRGTYTETEFTADVVPKSGNQLHPMVAFTAPEVGPLLEPAFDCFSYPAVSCFTAPEIDLGARSSETIPHEIGLGVRPSDVISSSMGGAWLPYHQPTQNETPSFDRVATKLPHELSTESFNSRINYKSEVTRPSNTGPTSFQDSTNTTSPSCDHSFGAAEVRLLLR
jgi:hypothetical protein